MRFTLSIEFHRDAPDEQPGREVDMGAYIEHGEDTPAAGWRIGFQSNDEESQ